jgi:predicted nucleic acid-binding protein
MHTGWAEAHPTPAKKAGYGMGLADAHIAAIASNLGATVATRDTAPFLAVGVKVVNPWLGV